MSARALRILSLPYGPLELLERHGLQEELARRGLSVAVEELPEPDEETEIGRAIALDRRLARRVREAVEHYAFPLVLAGDSASCLGTVAGLDHERLGVVWFDAHADLDTPDDSLSGSFDAMALAILTGSGWRALRESIPGFRPVEERDVVLVGVRDLEPHQRELLESSAVSVVAGAPRMGEIAAAIDDLSRRTGDVYLHVDLDVLAPGGLSLATLVEAIAVAGEWLEVRAAAIAGYDTGDEAAREAVEVAAVAADAGIRRSSSS